ncbi:MAG: TetR-like C-terminal domain-containing protein, partial [Dehalococcoidia bacterium]|nr:TetR-like C-terminal domain-containing protein [Dehalococcoidia bacterium]
ETKDDLLVSGMDHLTDDIERHMAEDPSAADMILPGLGIFKHVAENHTLFRALLGSRGIDIVHRAAVEAFTEHAMAAIERRAAAGEQTNIPVDARAAFAAGALMAFIGWWLDNDMPYAPEVMDDLYRQMTANA